MRVSLRLVLLLFCGGLLGALACSRRQTPIRALAGPTVDVPRFSIAVRLSPAAESQLRSLHETVEVIAYFDGDPLPGQGKYNPPMRDVYLGSDDKVVDENSIATFDNIKLPQKDWDRLADKNYYVTINTVSARKSARDNLLACNDPERRIDYFRNQTTEVKCWLIGEPNSSTK